jgi:NADPH:quinone reductase-like Zn-dependent oxidoreductase
MSTTKTNNKTMRAWAIDAYGGPQRLRLAELPVPKPGPADVLIHMHGAEIGDWDAMIREGEWPMGRPFPLVLGLAGAGTVAAKGSDVRAFVEGDRVYAYNYPMRHNGAWAEFMLVPAAYVAAAPTALDLVHAGAVPIAGLTADQSVTDLLKVQPKDVVLITAAAGGVGHLAVQLAARAGARVVATASRHNHEFLRDLGAELVIDYQTEDVVDAVRVRFAGVDKVLNGVSGDLANRLVGLVRGGGRMVDLTGSTSIERSDIFLNSEYVVRADSFRLARLSERFDDEHLKLEIQQIFPFEHADEALRVVEGKHVRGKLALEIASS